MRLGYTLFYVDDVPATMNFYATAFGLEKGFLHEDQYGEMLTGETKLGFVNHKTVSTHGFDYVKPHAKQPPPAFELGLVTAEVEAAYAKAVAAGAIAVSSPKSKPWGQVVAYVRDCNGFLVEICSPIE